MNGADVRNVKRLAQRLAVRDSDVIRFAVKCMLARLGPLYDLEVKGRNLVPVFVEYRHDIAPALARAHLLNGEPALAEETLRSAIDAAPKDTSLKIELARLLSQSDRADAAAAILDEAARAAPDDLAVRDAQIRCYLTKSDLLAARKAADDLKARAPDQAVAFYLSGLVAQARAQSDVAAREFERALSLKPDALDALVALARLDSERGRPEAAIARVAAVVAAQPANPVLHDLLGELYLAAKQYPQSDGWVQLKRGEVAQALPLLERAAERAPASNVIRYHLGMAQLRSGQPEKARTTLQSAVQGAQSFSGIEDARTALAQIQGHAG
jgi:tetratricopeptide (TPR) repeat protein